MSIASISDLEQFAGQSLARDAWGYYKSGANDEISLRENTSAFQRYKIRPRVLVNVSQIDMKTRVLGQEISMPICIAPTAMHKMACFEGEIATIKAAEQANTLMCLSSLSTSKLEQVGEFNGNLKWFQLYVFKDRIFTRDLVKRAELAGFTAIVVTVDAPYLGKREVDVRNGFALPKHLKLENLPEQMDKKSTGVAALQKYFVDQIDPSLEWKDLAWLVKLTRLPVIVKGIATKEDAELAIEYGAAAIWVSNHGARQLDTVAATIDMLEEISRVVNKRVQVYVDGGIRRGTDVFKAIALGADAVFIGRPVLYGLAYNGQQGVELALKILRDEFRLAMALAGVSSLSQINKSYLILPSRI